VEYLSEGEMRHICVAAEQASWGWLVDIEKEKKDSPRRICESSGLAVRLFRMVYGFGRKGGVLR